MREQSGAFIDIANSVRGATRRIVTVKGTPDPIAAALFLMTEGQCSCSRASQFLRVAGRRSTSRDLTRAVPPRPRSFAPPLLLRYSNVLFLSSLFVSPHLAHASVV